MYICTKLDNIARILRVLGVPVVCDTFQMVFCKEISGPFHFCDVIDDALRRVILYMADKHCPLLPTVLSEPTQVPGGQRKLWPH